MAFVGTQGHCSASLHLPIKLFDWGIYADNHFSLIMNPYLQLTVEFRN